jgi:hypothetical protein
MGLPPDCWRSQEALWEETFFRTFTRFQGVKCFDSSLTTTAQKLFTQCTGGDSGPHLGLKIRSRIDIHAAVQERLHALGGRVHQLVFNVIQRILHRLEISEQF